jgi:hypothetical protein
LSRRPGDEESLRREGVDDAEEHSTAVYGVGSGLTVPAACQRPGDLRVMPAEVPEGVLDAVPTGHIYWANPSTFPGTIGRADLDGSNANQSFISGVNNPAGVAVDGSHVYWTNTNGTIGRADLDGQNVNLSFISSAFDPRGVGVDGSHIYWTNFNDGTGGPAELDGQNVNQSFISGAFGPNGVAVDGGHVYWTNTNGTVGRADLDGQNANQGFISGVNNPQGWRSTATMSTGGTPSPARSGGPTWTARTRTRASSPAPPTCWSAWRSGHSPTPTRRWASPPAAALAPRLHERPDFLDAWGRATATSWFGAVVIVVGVPRGSGPTDSESAKAPDWQALSRG